MLYIQLKRLLRVAVRSVKIIKCVLGNIVSTSYLINIVHLLVLHHCSLMYKMHGKTHIKKG